MKTGNVSKPKVIVVCIIILFSGAYSIRQYLRIRRANIVAEYKQAISQKISQYHSKLTDKNTDLISGWMTFDYINKIFALPTDYLKNSLVISNTHYPWIPVSRYAKDSKLDETLFTAKVRKTVANYFLNK
jgi:hypothetical protein